jgi:hypothetical protein
MTLSNKQVVDLVRQLPPEEKLVALKVLATEAHSSRQTRMIYAETQLRQIAMERGLDWDSMSEEEKENFIDDLLHEE